MRGLTWKIRARSRLRPSRSSASPVLLAYVSIRQHTSAYVSIRQHTSALEIERVSGTTSIRQHTSAYVAYVSIRQRSRSSASPVLLAYYYICVLILPYMCPHTTVYVSSYYYICVLILLYMCPHTGAYWRGDEKRSDARLLTYAHICSRMLTYADRRVLARR